VWSACPETWFRNGQRGQIHPSNAPLKDIQTKISNVLPAAGLRLIAKCIATFLVSFRARVYNNMSDGRFSLTDRLPAI